MSGPARLAALLVKPAGADCNLACDYCFYLGAGALYPQRPRMTLATLEAMLGQALAQADAGLAICFQGGEPTLMGLDFYRRAVALCLASGRRVQLSLQTNGLLLDDAWVAFLRRYGILVGLSLDGPAALHDRHRRHGDGRPSHAGAETAARRLLAAGVAVNALTCVTAGAAGHAAATYGYLRDLGFTWMQFLPVLEPDPGDPGRASAWSLDGEGYGWFLCDLFDAWRADFRDGRPQVSIRTFEALYAGLTGRPGPECTFQATCGDYLVVEHNGDVFSCDFFVAADRRLGNLHQDRLADLLNSPAHAAFGRAKADLDRRCRACPWLAQCRGGCPKDRFRDPRDGGHNHFCAAYQRLLAHAAPELRRLAYTR